MSEHIKRLNDPEMTQDLARQIIGDRPLSISLDDVLALAVIADPIAYNSLAVRQTVKLGEILNAVIDRGLVAAQSGAED